ncbi:hypothetical protein B0T25DRAFT_597222 [Lasiosphaeria hispida]|uniref:Uncharacterized protein n=1 Tax=Lasiosphaeria hispida TaxID=260671 RepID=A0AAJ0HVY0_9PEZI|nr:hypothetical protein B0T25DRAFT_597222 [Lasiosphaeria hispida]
MADHSAERIMADQSTERIMADQSTERGLDHEEAPLLDRSHSALLRDLAELCKTYGDTPSFDMQETFPFKIGKYEYDGTTLYFKNITIVQGGVGGTVSDEVREQLRVLKRHPEVSTLVRQLGSHGDRPAYISDISFSKPSFAFGKDRSPLPTLVGQVNYSHRFTREQLEAKYQAHLFQSDGKIRTVMYIDLYYAGTGQKMLQTAQDLDRSTISV